MRFLRGHIDFAGFSAGSTLGLNVEAALRPLFGGWSSEKVRFTGRFALGSRLLFDAQRQTGRLAICSVPVPQVEIAIRAFSRCRRGYRAWRVHFGIVCLFAAISTGYRGCVGTGLAARVLCVFTQPY